VFSDLDLSTRPVLTVYVGFSGEQVKVDLRTSHRA